MIDLTNRKRNRISKLKGYMLRTYVKYVALYGILGTDSINMIVRKINTIFERVVIDATATTDKYWLCSCKCINIHDDTEYRCSGCSTNRMSGTDATIMQAIDYLTLGT